MSSEMDESMEREPIPSNTPLPPFKTQRFVVEITSRFSDVHSAIAAHLMMQNDPEGDWYWHGRVLSEDGTLVVNWPIVCLEGNTSDDPDDPCNCPTACDPVGEGCAAPKPSETLPRLEIVEAEPMTIVKRLFEERPRVIARRENEYPKGPIDWWLHPEYHEDGTLTLHYRGWTMNWDEKIVLEHERNWVTVELLSDAEDTAIGTRQTVWLEWGDHVTEIAIQENELES